MPSSGAMLNVVLIVPQRPWARSAVDAVIRLLPQLAAGSCSTIGTMRIHNLLVSGTQTDLLSCACHVFARAVRFPVKLQVVCVSRPTVAPPHALRLWEGFLIHAPGRISFFLSFFISLCVAQWDHRTGF